MIDTCGVETARPSFDSMHHVALLKKEFRQVTAVLAGNASDQGCFRRGGGHEGVGDFVGQFGLKPTTGSDHLKRASIGESDASAVQNNRSACGYQDAETP